MTLEDIEKHFLTMGGDQLLHELTVFTAKYFDAHFNQEEDHLEVILRAIQTRLAETGIAQLVHEETCRFMRGEDPCACPHAAWSWPRKDPPQGVL